MYVRKGVLQIPLLAILTPPPTPHPFPHCVSTALLVVLAATIVEFRKVDPAASTLLLPYFAFSAFAAALTYAFRQRNPPKVD